MNVYESFIGYLKGQVNHVDVLIERANVEYTKYRNLDFIIRQLDELNLVELGNTSIINQIVSTLNGLVDKNIIDEINDKLTDIFSYAEFIDEDNIIIKNVINDFNKIKSRLIDIKEDIISLDINNLNNKKRILEYYLEIIDNNGFNTVLSDDKREEFYELIIDSSLTDEDKFLLIKSYLNYHLDEKDRIKQEANKLEEEKIRAEEENKRREELELLDKINKLLEMHPLDINSDKYKEYKNKFMELDILSIYANRGEFIDYDGVNWDVVVPCLKERLLKEIDGVNHNQIINILRIIVSISSTELDKYDDFIKERNEREEKIRLQKEEEERKRELEEKRRREEEERERLRKEEYKNKLADFVYKLEEVMRYIKSINTKANFIRSKMYDISQKNPYFVSRLEDKKAGGEIDNVFLNSLNITEKEIDVILTLDKIETGIKGLKDLFSEMFLSSGTETVKEYPLDDLNDFFLELNVYKSKISSCDEVIDEIVKYYRKLEENNNSDEQTVDIELASKQYESGKRVIVFFRKDDESRFLVEEDIENQSTRKSLTDQDYKDIFDMLNKTSTMDKTEWDMSVNTKGSLKSNISYNKKNGGKGNDIVLTSKFSGRQYNYQRLKSNGSTIPRLSIIQIMICEENRRKLNLRDDQPIVIVIGETQVTKHSNEGADYSNFIKEYNDNYDDIQDFIKLFEDPTASVEELYKLLNDSSDLYVKFADKARGIGG